MESCNFLNYIYILLFQGFLEYYSLPFPQQDMLVLQSGTESSSWPEGVLQSGTESSSWPEGVQFELYTLPVSHFIYYLSISTFCVQYKYQLYLHFAYSTFFSAFSRIDNVLPNIPS
jgi:hypothetical protein